MFYLKPRVHVLYKAVQIEPLILISGPNPQPLSLHLESENSWRLQIVKKLMVLRINLIEAEHKKIADITQNCQEHVSFHLNNISWSSGTGETRKNTAEMIKRWQQPVETKLGYQHKNAIYVNCLRNSVATNRPRVFTDSLSSLISLSISCKMHTWMY